MTNREKADLVQAIMNKYNVDKSIESAPDTLPKKPKTFSQKAKEVNDYIKNQLAPNEIDLFISSATQKDKAKAVDLIFKDFQNQKNNDKTDKKKKAVDKSAEILRNRSGALPMSISYADKSAYFDNLQNYYKKEKKQSATKKQIDNTLEIKRSNPGSLQVNNSNVFKNIQANLSTNGKKDYLWYTHQINKYSNTTDVRKFVETDSRTQNYLSASPGQMFSFRYFAKTESMRVFDRSPMVYILENNGGTFKGINFHWIKNKHLRFEIVEQLLQGETDIVYPRESFHTYSTDNKCLLSPLYHIKMEEWRTAVLLNLERWYFR